MEGELDRTSCPRLMGTIKPCCNCN